MKKLIMMLAVLTATLTASAQFEQGKLYFGSSLSSLDLSYSGSSKLNLGMGAQAGYLVDDNLMVLGLLNYQHNANEMVPDYISLGVGGRYYIQQNGIYLGASCKFVHAYHNYNDIVPGAEVGYAFFLSRTVTVEPAIYYEHSLKNHSEYSTIGFKIGFGIYL